MILAWFTNKFLEKPLSRQSHLFSAARALFILMLALGGIGLFTYTYDGLKFRYAAEIHHNYEGDIGHIQYHQYISHNFFIQFCLEIRKKYSNEDFVKKKS